MSGAKYAFNTKRMFFNRVYDAALTDVTFDESGTEMPMRSTITPSTGW